MHPPFGFALFYLRSVAPAKEYLDKYSGRKTAPVTTGQIYWGAVPFVLIQIVMVGLIIAFPKIVSGGLDTKAKIDIQNIRIETPADVSTPCPTSGGAMSNGTSHQGTRAGMGGGCADKPAEPASNAPARLRAPSFGGAVKRRACSAC
jgi:hypothetical protein